MGTPSLPQRENRVQLLGGGAFAYHLLVAP